MTEEEKRFHQKMADRLIETREAAGITQEKLAEKVGLQSNSIHRYEAAERKMNLFTAVKMQMYLIQQWKGWFRRSTYTKPKRLILKEKRKMYSISYHQKNKKCSSGR